MAVRIEDAGFEIRDMIAWVYGSGFPKSLDVSKAIDKAAGAEREVVATCKAAVGFDAEKQGGGGWSAGEVTITAPATEAAKQWAGWGTALKPALEPITVARKPLSGTVAANVLRYGTGGINVDACRIGTDDNIFGKYYKKPGEYQQPQGRWPANLIHDGSDEVVGLFPETDGVVGARREGGDKSIFSGGGHTQTNKQSIVGGSKDTGSAARFFYTAKAYKSDRGHGNNHPTVKPVDLMRYLVRLVCPMGGIVLDPFNGSGTTAVASRAEHCRYIGAELNEDYCRITIERLAQGVLF
jgi:site-specific DNA-methyltransferase (adenine-specific)